MPNPSKEAQTGIGDLLPCATPSTLEHFRFMDLPREIRDMIYHLLWLEKPSIRVGGGFSRSTRVAARYQEVPRSRTLSDFTHRCLPRWLLTSKVFLDEGMTQFRHKTTWITSGVGSATGIPFPQYATMNPITAETLILHWVDLDFEFVYTHSEDVIKMIVTFIKRHPRWLDDWLQSPDRQPPTNIKTLNLVIRADRGHSYELLAIASEMKKNAAVPGRVQEPIDLHVLERVVAACPRLTALQIDVRKSILATEIGRAFREALKKELEDLDWVGFTGKKAAIQLLRSERVTRSEGIASDWRFEVTLA